MEQLELMSFMEWRQKNPVKKKEKKDESGSVPSNGEIGIKNDEGQTAGNHSEVPVQNVHVFPSPEL